MREGQKCGRNKNLAARIHGPLVGPGSSGVFYAVSCYLVEERRLQAFETAHLIQASVEYMISFSPQQSFSL